MFITFEGGEGAGKSTLQVSLAEWLGKTHPVLLTREPGGTKLGEAIRGLLLHGEHVEAKAELFLFLAARIQHVETVIKPALQAGKIVLCDRFSDSTIAYQGAGRNLGVEYVKQATELAIGNFSPDLTFYLDIEPKAGLSRAEKRSQFDRFEEEEMQFHERIRAAFLALAKGESARVHVLDATKPKEALFSDAQKVINARL